MSCFMATIIHFFTCYLLSERMSKPFSIVSMPAGTAMVNRSRSRLPFSLLKPSLSSWYANLGFWDKKNKWLKVVSWCKIDKVIF